MPTASKSNTRSRKVCPTEAASASPQRASDLLRGLLDDNPDIKVFTIETVMRSLGEDRFDANLIFLTLPTLNPLHDKATLTSMSAALTAGQMAAGRPTFSLPPTLLKQEIPRRSLAIAIHAALPVIEAAESFARPRFGWLNGPFCRRVLGLFLFVLSAVVAFPLVGFDPLQSLSTFVISLGIAEGDGAVILLGVAVGVLSLAVIVASTLSGRALRAKAAAWLRRIATSFGASALARFCERRGLTWIARVLTFQWTDLLLLLWNPERAPARTVPKAAPQESAPKEPARRLVGGARSVGRSKSGKQRPSERIAA